MSIFRYLEEKDIFQTFYWTKLSNRLIRMRNVSTSYKAEESMISKLKEACGFEYTNKFQRMLTGRLFRPLRKAIAAHNVVDMSLSKKLTESFKEYMEQNHNDMDMTFSFTAIGENFWPVNPPKDDFMVPTDIELTWDRFQRYYERKHSGRKLMWLWKHSKNELETSYLDQKYIFMTSTYQMAVLLQYNNNDRLSLDKLATATNLEKSLLTQVLQSLVKSRNDEIDQYDLNLRTSYPSMRPLCTFPHSKIFRVHIREKPSEPEHTSASRCRCRFQCCREDGGRKSQICYSGNYCPVRIL